MALIVMPSLLSKRPWARIRARCEASFFIVLSKSVRCCSVRGRTYLTLIALKIGVTCHIALELSREILYQKTFGRALIRMCLMEIFGLKPVKDSQWRALIEAISSMFWRITLAMACLASFHCTCLQLQNIYRCSIMATAEG